MAEGVLRRIRARVLGHIVQYGRRLFHRALSNNKIRGNPRRLQPVQAVGRGEITCAPNVTIGYFPSPMFFSTYAYLEARKPGAQIFIGEGTAINNNFRAIAEASFIRIGKHCLIGTNVEILDSDFHHIDPAKREQGVPHRAQNVVIGDKVFIGSNVRILKGASIGAGSVIANGAVVTGDIPPMSIAAGVPAKVLHKVG